MSVDDAPDDFRSCSSMLFNLERSDSKSVVDSCSNARASSGAVTARCGPGRSGEGGAVVSSVVMTGDKLLPPRRCFE